MPALRQLVSKYRINLATHPALTGNQSERRIRFILLSRKQPYYKKALSFIMERRSVTSRYQGSQISGSQQ